MMYMLCNIITYDSVNVNSMKNEEFGTSQLKDYKCLDQA